MNHLNFYHLFLVSIIVSFGFGCSDAKSVEHQKIPLTTIKTNDSQTKKDTIVFVTPKNLLPKKDFTELKFDNITLLIQELATGRIIDFDERGTTKDTLEIDYDLPESVQGQFLFIKNCNLTEVKVEYQYETSLSLNMEGPHWDLYDWKHYSSKWKELIPTDHKYKIPTLTSKQMNQFPPYTEEELHDYVEWDSLKAEYSDSEIFTLIGVSRIYIKVTGIVKNKKHTYFIAFYEPMGC